MTITTGKTTIPQQRVAGARRDARQPQSGVRPGRRVAALLVLVLTGIISTGAFLVRDSGEVETGPGAATTYDPAEQRWGGPDVHDRAYDPARQRWGGPDVHDHTSAG